MRPPPVQLRLTQHGFLLAVLFVLLPGMVACAAVPSDLSAPFPPTATLPAVPAVANAAATAANGPAATAVTSTQPVATPAAPAQATAYPVVPPAAPTTQPCTTPGQIVTGTYSSVLNGESRYRIYLPPCYGVDGRVYPTLTLLPGNVHDDSIWDMLGIDEAAEALIRQGALPPLLIVMADGGNLYQNTSGGPGSYESQILDELIPFVEAHYCAWAEGNGRAIGGLSRGGYWALEIAFRHPDAFASVAGHSPALIDSYAGPDLNPQVTGLTHPLGDLRVAFDIGENDGYRYQIEQLHNDMTARAIPHDWTLNPGAHVEDYWAAHTADYLLWYTRPWPFDRTRYPQCP